jgi:hypothetical protein
VATIAECEDAFAVLAKRLSSVDPETRKRKVLDRSLCCTMSDLDVVFGAQLRDGGLHDVHRVEKASGQIKLSLSSDDLIALTDGSLAFAKAWTSGRLRIEANVFDLLKLRSLL